ADFTTSDATVAPRTRLTLVRPTEGLELAYDPRLPSDRQAFVFVVDGVRPNHRIVWVLNGQLLASTQSGRFLWPVERGVYTLLAKEVDDEDNILSSDVVHFQVK